jgi:hypothetical protein
MLYLEFQSGMVLVTEAPLCSPEHSFKLRSPFIFDHSYHRTGMYFGLPTNALSPYLLRLKLLVGARIAI